MKTAIVHLQTMCLEIFQIYNIQLQIIFLVELIKQVNLKMILYQKFTVFLKTTALINQFFFDIDKWKAMGPEGIKELENYFEFIPEKAKEDKQQD